MEETEIQCPYCGALITILLDCSVEEQSYYEDCQVCCAPMLIDFTVDEQGEPQQLQVRRDNE